MRFIPGLVLFASTIRDRGWLAVAATVLVLAAPRATAAAVETPRDFAWAAQPLADALEMFSKTTGIATAASADLLTGKMAPAVKGRFMASQVLAQLLAPNGLVFHFTSEHFVAISAAPPATEAGSTRAAPNESGVVRLEPFDVSGRRARDFVAKESLAGTKTSVPLVETPQTIAVITREQMDQQAVKTVPQALRYANVLSEPRGDMTKLEYIYARGFTVDQYLDGLKLLGGSWGIAQIDAYALERIEVLSGPASVLYGQANPGGIANLVSKRPTTESINEVQLQFGSHNLVQGAFDLGGSAGEQGAFSYRLTALARDADTQVDHAKDQRVMIAPAATWRIGTDTTLTVLANYQQDPHGGFYNWVTVYGTVLPNPNGTLPTSFDSGDPGFDAYKRTQYSIGYLLDHRVNDTWSVHQNVRIGSIDTAYNNIFSSWLDEDFRTLHRYTWRDKERIDALTLDNRIEGKFDTGSLRQTVLFGVDYQHNHYDQRLGYDFSGAPDLDIFTPVYHQPIATPDFTDHTVQTQNQLGLYVQDQARIGHWALLAGGRYDTARSKTEDLAYDGRLEQKDHAFTGRAGAVYLFEHGFAPYVSYSRSFQPTSGTDFFGNPFKPTTGRQYEAGVKFQPKGSNAFVTVSAFDLRQQNVTTTDPDPTHPNASVQTGEIRSRGIEFSAVANLPGGFNLTAAYSHLDNVVTKSNETNDPFGNNLGKHPTTMPENAASLWIDYSFSRDMWRGLELGLGVRYVGSSYGNTLNTFEVPAYAILDAAVRYDFAHLAPQLKGWSANVNVSNLLDKRYVASADGEDYAAFGLRRTITATLHYRW
jgi:iron complex outermembrane receptor protein